MAAKRWCKADGGWGRSALAAVLVVAMLDRPMLAVAAAAPVPPVRRSSEQVLHALNRFTFGPRPGEADAVARMGLERWFELQLNPGSIDDSALEQRLGDYPAMQLSSEELQARYPSPQRLRQIENGMLPRPTDPALRTIVDDQIAFYEQRQQAQKASGQDAGVETQPAMDGKTANREGMDDPAQGIAERFAPAESTRILALPADRRMQAILSLAPADLVRFRRSLSPAQVAEVTQGLTPEQREMLTALPGSLRMVALEAMETRVIRDVYSERELEAVMTDFWLNHFNVYVRKNQNETYLLPDYERTIRANALGNFEALLVATATSPAMLEYLDNFRSIGPGSQAAERVKQVQRMRPDGKLAKASAGLNENYGRELMELHTLGVNGGYTQADVTQVAKVFTGWTIDRPYGGAGGTPDGRGGFVFDARRHEPGSKTVLGHTIHEAGMQEGLQVLHLLASSPATAHFLCGQLAVRFVSDAPPQALVDRMADTFLQTHGNIKSVLRTMFHAPEFWSPAMVHAKVKTPEEFVFSAARASNLAIADPAALVRSLDKLGMPLYGMQTPNGYSWKQDGWVSTGALVSRMNFALVLSGDRLPGTHTAWDGLLQQSATAGATPVSYSSQSGAEAKEKRLEQVLLGDPASERTRATVLNQASDTTVTEQAATQFDLSGGRQGSYRMGAEGAQPAARPDDNQAAVMAGLLIGSPEFQRR